MYVSDMIINSVWEGQVLNHLLITGSTVTRKEKSILADVSERVKCGVRCIILWYTSVRWIVVWCMVQCYVTTAACTYGKLPRHNHYYDKYYICTAMKAGLCNTDTTIEVADVRSLLILSFSKWKTCPSSFVFDCFTPLASFTSLNIKIVLCVEDIVYVSNNKFI